MRCLLIKNDGIGDLILASGIITEISKIFIDKGIKTDLITCEQNKEVAENIQGIHTIYYVSRDDLKLKRSPTSLYIKYTACGPRKDINILKQISKIEYSHVFVLRRFMRQSTLAIMLNVKAQEKFCAFQFLTNASDKQAKFCSRGWNRYNIDLKIIPESLFYQELIKKALNKSIDITPRLNSHCDKTLTPTVKSIALGIGGLSSKWCLSNWIQLIEWLHKSNWKITILGGNDATETAEHLLNRFPNITNYVGLLTFKDNEKILKTVEIYVGNDTGLSHYASLFVQRCFIILGGGTFQRFFPWPKSINQYVLYNGLSCFDCDWRCKYKEKFCLTSITSTDLIKYIKDVLSGIPVLHERNIQNHNIKYLLAWRRMSKKVEISINCPSS
tara:strand:+ start:161 stop:1318 length:1158 start_codon:yes stop_codon:yes gene_type:complete